MNSKLKRLCSYDQQRNEPVIVESIKHLSYKEQAEIIADKFAKVSQEYEPLKNEDINIPEFEKNSIPVFSPTDVQRQLEKVKLKKAVPSGDIPPLLTRMFAAKLSVPVCDAINSSVRLGQWSKLYKRERVLLQFQRSSPPNLRKSLEI